jgi:hypothetical protein
VGTCFVGAINKVASAHASFFSPLVGANRLKKISFFETQHSIYSAQLPPHSADMRAKKQSDTELVELNYNTLQHDLGSGEYLAKKTNNSSGTAWSPSHTGLFSHSSSPLATQDIFSGAL